MNFVTQLLHLVGSGAVAYISARNIRDSRTRPNTLAAFQLAESGSVPFLTSLSERAAAEGDSWLAQMLALHAADERRHGNIFAQALKQWDKEVIDFKSLPKPAENKGEKPKRSPFFAAYFDGYDAEFFKPDKIEWPVFMASTYILELDASTDFARMANVLPDDDLRCRNLKKGMLSIASDETRHAAYLYEAMERRFSAREVENLVDEWRTRKVNALLAMVGNFVKGGGNPNLVKDGVPVDVSGENSSELKAA
ncbi:ferritin-like domain-containing protein [Ancylothrix sp. C2]|uniref:ferritin-like domain-containing protein n=1 Tax=Ancylothrix sp. D3o TaxID=2953691 RepID=UPI0021BB2B11|nr:ferritin-like domain-containing protein [Ancylothrix sp. D3o]MCT7951803.1 ferritin-like domain-containing protein [Ancylothrix sp. D3o]